MVNLDEFKYYSAHIAIFRGKMEDIFSIYKLVVTVLVYFAILVYFITGKNNMDRLHFLLVIIGFFALDSYINDIFVSELFIAAWLIAMNIELMLPRYLAIIFLVVAAVVRAYSPTFIIISGLLYITILWGFVFGAFKKLAGLLSQ